MKNLKEYSDNDYLDLTETYFKNEWISKGANFKGFEVLWFDFNSSKSRNILKRLISNFKYVDQEQAKFDTKNALKEAIVKWSVEPKDTCFIGFKSDDFSDGSSIILNFIRPILKEINFEWRNTNLYSDLQSGLTNTSENRNIKSIILIDDFIGSGATAVKIIEKVKEFISNKNIDVNIYVFSLGAMLEGKNKIDRLKVGFTATYIIDKGTNITFPKNQRSAARKEIINLEETLYKSCKVRIDFSLGYEKSEALYAWNVFNIPNNNYPMFWWNRYKNGDYRTTMFTRN